MSQQLLLKVALCLAVAGPLTLRAVSLRPQAPAPVDRLSAEAGKALFLHEWTVNDPLCPEGDGLGPVFNAKSCVACHRQGGVGGSGPNDSNVTTFIVRPVAFRSRDAHAVFNANAAPRNLEPRSGLVHSQAIRPEFQESLRLVHPELPLAVPRPQVSTAATVSSCDVNVISFPPGIHISERKTPALFGAKLINEIPDREIIANERRQQLKWGLATADGDSLPVGRALRVAGGRIGHFGWKAQTASLEQFVQAACANELGLGNPANAQARSLARTGYEAPGIDLTLEQCSQITAFIASLPSPIERVPEDITPRKTCEEGKQLFTKVGCADCHQPAVGSVDGIYSDLLLHDMGPQLSGGGSYGDPPPELPEIVDGPRPGEWRTPPLWGVADAGPYLHDGRAKTLEEAIAGHGGQGQIARGRFLALPPGEQAQVIAFLNTLRAPEAK